MKGKTLLVKVFTHPMCTSCKSAIQMVERLARQREDVDVQIVSLASQNGRREAEREKILSVPTILVGTNGRLVGVPRWEELVAAIEAEVARVKEG
ncbi:MAG: thioredoxin family protein [Thermoflexus sp.]|nr:thioredoxin domain-containing protein [Thermoflexus sp.]MDT7947199.1 thioredoxin family protein [Thermoflexus sp.]